MRVAQVATGTLEVAAYPSLKGKTSHVKPVDVRSFQFFPAQQVSAIESISFVLMYPIFSLSVLRLLVVALPTYRRSPQMTAATFRQAWCCPAPKRLPFCWPRCPLTGGSNPMLGGGRGTVTVPGVVPVVTSEATVVSEARAPTFRSWSPP
jgi:hypothetical protein